jgi:HEPN domain-containing protein
MSVSESVRSYIQLAEEELRAAELLAPTNPRQAIYMVAQAAEKSARAILTNEGIAFGNLHSFGQMAQKLPADHPWRQRINDLDRLSSASTRYRYPTATGRLAQAPETKALRDDIHEVSRFLEDARRDLGL